MPQPDFTAQEALIINSIKAASTQRLIEPQVWGYLGGAILLTAIALYEGGQLGMLIAVVVLCGYRVYESRSSVKWLPIYKSVISKYEAAVADANHQHSDSAESR